MALNGWIHATRAASAVGLALFALVTIAASPDSRTSDVFNVWVYNALMVFACVVVASRAVLVPRERAAWTAFTLALVSWSFGELWYAAVQPEGYPSLADAGFLAFYPLVYIGMVLLLRTHAGAVGGTLWLDGLTASLATGAIAAAVLVELVLETTEGSLSTVATNLAYPLGDLLLLSAVVGIFSLARWRPGRRWSLIGLGVLSTALADAVFLFQSAEDTYVEGTWVDVFWPASMLLLAAAAWVPDRAAERVDVHGRSLLAVPAVCALVSIALLADDHFHRMNLLALALATATLLAVVLRLGITFRENRRLYELTRHEAVTDPLTGLGNRRKLLQDLQHWLDADGVRPRLLMIFDLDGFKGYNDTFGHPAGDALLARLGAKLAEVAKADGAAYRLGGDEFCLISQIAPTDAELVIDRACAALTEHGEGFEITSSFGAVLLPDEASDASGALHVADERLYAQKHSRRAEGSRTVKALLDALSYHEPDMPTHVAGVVSLALDTGRLLGLGSGELDELASAAQLHDLGKLAVPDEILQKEDALDDHEWAFVRQHTIVGERILKASPGLRSVAPIVRSTHERWDGGGYPDGLAAQEIPLAARIVAVCDAYEAMTSARPYGSALTQSEALAELERLAGSQFDPAVVRALVAHLRTAAASPSVHQSDSASAKESRPAA